MSEPADAPAPVVWVGGAQRDDASAALVEWARARGVKLVDLDETATTVAASRIDLTIADRVEKDLDRARDAIGATDADAAERALARVDALLREHPELPQAAWLRAEVERAWSQRWLRIEPRDEARARTAWENAHALDGGRVAGIGETSFPPRAKMKTTIVVDGAGAILLFDGSQIDPTSTTRTNATYAIDIEPAEHQLIAQLDGRAVFASWVAIAASTTNAPIHITVASGGSCSKDQLLSSNVEVQDRTVVVTKDSMTCPAWIAATPGAKPGTVLVARCERDACGPLLEWRVERLGGGVAGLPPQKLDKHSTWPAWATWTLLGIGAATATSVALVATGVFESRPVEQRFVVGGARQE